MSKKAIDKVLLLVVLTGLDDVQADQTPPKRSLRIHTDRHLIIAETNNMIPSVIALVELAPR
jgi:hypothetical protein